MSPCIPQWEPRKSWVQYEDGSFEPMNPQEDINKKKRGNHGQARPDWWVVNQPPDWRPEKYADTKRGKKAERELGFAEMPKKEQPAAPASGTMDYKAPQHENTGKAMAKLGGEGDGKITLLDNDLEPIGQDKISAKTLRNSTQDAARLRKSLLSSQLREDNARTDVDHRTEHEKRKGLGKELGPGRRAVTAAREQNGSGADSQGGFWGGMKKIGDGLGELWEKAPAGIGEALDKGWDGTKEAVGKTAEAYATNEDLRKYTLISLGAGAAPIVLAGAPQAVAAAAPHAGKITRGVSAAAGAAKSKAREAATAATGTILGNPELVNQAGEFVTGATVPGPPNPTVGGYLGGLTREAYDRTKKWGR